MGLVVGLIKHTAYYLGASPHPTWHAVVKTLVVPQARLPKVLAILMHLELVPRGAVHYIQDPSFARIVGFPTGLIPTALIRPLSRDGINALSSYSYLHFRK